MSPRARILALWLVCVPGFAASQVDLAQVRALIDQRQLALAEEQTVRRLAADSRNVEWILLLAEIRLDQQRLGESLQLLAGARQLGDDSARNHLLAGLNYVASGHLDVAEPELRTAARLDPSDAQALYYLGRLLYAKNSFDEAIETTRSALHLDPGLVRAYDNLGLCYEATQRQAEAEQAYSEGIRRQRLSAVKTEWPALNLGIMLLKRGDLPQAKSYLEQALEVNPKSAEAHFRLGSVLERQGDLAAALTQYGQAIEYDPRHAGAHYRAGRICQRMGKTAEAEEHIRAFQKYSGKKTPG
jgi:tetratricopeptide (TPR) repeat protein